MDIMALLTRELEGITSLCCLQIGQYLHHMTLCPPVAIVKRCYGLHPYQFLGPPAQSPQGKLTAFLCFSRQGTRCWRPLEHRDQSQFTYSDV